MTENNHALVQTMTDNELITVLSNSLYPGASDEAASLVLGYCRAAGLDPMLKPVHIVPMRVKTGMNGNKPVYGMRDTIMPGVGLYRTQAARTGQYAGQDEPVFGPERTLDYIAKKTVWEQGQGRDTFEPRTLVYPDSCSVTVYRLVGGFRSAFTATEYWIENYATAGRDTDAPNEMWGKRVRGQLAKCAEAQALRKAFPEVGSVPTADEMEGRYTVEQEPAPEFIAPVKPMRASEKAALAHAPTEPVMDVNPVVPTAAVEQVTQQQTAPQPQAAPAPQQQAAATPATPATGEPASAGECMNVIVTAKAKKVNLPALMESLGIVGLNAENMTGMTKADFKRLKGAM